MKKKFKVTVSMPIIHQTTMILEAEREEDLLDLAIDEVSSNSALDWRELSGHEDEIEIEKVEEVK